MKTFYVYQITFVDNTYYIGYRGTSQPALNDLLVKYFTSSKTVKAKLVHCHHTATILHENLSKEDAYNKVLGILSDIRDQAERDM